MLTWQSIPMFIWWGSARLANDRPFKQPWVWAWSEGLILVSVKHCKWELSSHVQIGDMRGQPATSKPPYNNFLASTPNNSFGLGTQSQGYYSSTNINDVLSHESPSFPKTHTGPNFTDNRPTRKDFQPN